MVNLNEKLFEKNFEQGNSKEKLSIDVNIQFTKISQVTGQIKP